MASVPDNIRALVYALHQLGGGEVTRGQAGIRINVSGLNVPTDAPWENCFSIDLSAEALARVIQALQPSHALSADERALLTQVGDIFDRVDFDALTKTVLNDAKPADRMTVTRAIDGMFGHIPHWDAKDGEL
jgi:hypothetical protein